MQNYFETLNLFGTGPKTQEEFIELSKLMSKVLSSSNKKKSRNKEKRCFLCKNKNIKFCNSHTIPRFVLENIAPDGKVNNTQIFNSTKLSKPDSGINNTHTFHLICKKCDNEIYKEYETPVNLEREPSQEMMKQIALKNHLSRMYKHNKENAKLFLKNKYRDSRGKNC